MDLELFVEYRALEKVKQTPEIVSRRRELANKIIEYDIAEQQKRLAKLLAVEYADDRDKWDARWDDGLVEEVIRVQQQLKKENLSWVTQNLIL